MITSVTVANLDQLSPWPGSSPPDPFDRLILPSPPSQPLTPTEFTFGPSMVGTCHRKR